MSAPITRDTFGAMAAKYGWEYDAGTGTLTADGTAYPITWTKRGHIPPRAPVWRAMRGTPAFARDYPLKAPASRKAAAVAVAAAPEAGQDAAAAVLSPEFWAGLSPAELDKARQAMDRGAKLARERAAEKLRRQYAELRQEAEAIGIKLPPLE